MGRQKVTKNAAALPERLRDMPLAKGRVAKSSLVFYEGGAELRLGNLERPIVWKLALARQAKSEATAMAESFSAFGNRHVHAFKDVPAMPAEQSPAIGPSVAIDGLTEFGLQTDDDHEYFVSKFGDLVGIVRIARKNGGSWTASLAKTLVPRVLTDEAVSKGLMPPAGHSGLPKSLESVVPEEYRYWQASSPAEAIQMRDALVESGFFGEDTIKAVDGELRKVEVKYYLYEPGSDVLSAKAVAKRLPTLGDRVMKVIPGDFVGKAFTPMEKADWLEALDADDAPGNLAILSPADRTTSVREMARAASTLKGDFLLEHEDTKMARAAFGAVGQLFKMKGEPSRLFCSSFAPENIDQISWLAKAADGKVLKTIDFQGIKVQIDRPVGFVQKGTDPDGNAWERVYSADYGFIPKTNGGDGGSLDVFVGKSAKAESAFMVTTKKADGTFDEYKLFLGYDSLGEVLSVFKAHIPMRFFGDVSELTVGAVKSLLNLDPVEVAKQVRAAVVKVAGVSYDQLRCLMNEALTEAYGEDPPEGGCCGPYSIYCDDLYDDKAIFFKEGKSYAIGYTYEGGAVQLQGTPTPVVRTWQPVGQGGDVQMRAGSSSAPARKRELEVVRTLTVKRAVAKDGEQRYALGIVLEPDIVDAQNDTYSAEDIRSAFEKYAEHFRNVGLMHKTGVNDKVAIVENYIAPVDFELGGITVKKGTWLMGVRLNDDALWSGVRDGSITGFSIGGSAIRKPVA